MYFSRVRIRPDIHQNSQLARLIQGNNYGSHRLLWDLFDTEQRQFIYREEIAREQLTTDNTVRAEPIYYIVSQTPPKTDTPLFDVQSKPYQPKLALGQRLTFDCRLNPTITRNGMRHDVVIDTQQNYLKTLVQHCQLSSTANKAIKSHYKTLLLEQGGETLEQLLNQHLTNSPHYAERLHYISNLADKLEWAIKAQVDAALENWFLSKKAMQKNTSNPLLEELGFSVLKDQLGLYKLQNTAYQWHALPEKAKKPNDKSGFSSVDFTGELQITNVEQFKNALFHGIGSAKAFGCGLMLIKRHKGD